MNRRLAPVLVIVLLSALTLSAQQPEIVQAPQLPARVAPPSPDASAAQLEEQADQLRVDKAYLDAIDYYRAAIKKQNSATTWNKLGMTELLMGRLHDARKDFQKSMKVDKTYADARNNLGVVYYEMKKYGKAVKYYRQALVIRETASFHSNLGAAYFSKKDMVRAIAEYRRAIELDPNVLERTSNTGVAAQLSSPNDRAHYFYLLAKLYAGNGDLDRSLECLRRSMEDGYKEIGDVYKDQQFAGLRKDPRFAELMASKPVAIPQ
jgi:tetratricopeptide (TPR) repeat protein